MISFAGKVRRLASLRPQSVVQAFQFLITYVPAATLVLALIWQVGTEAFDSSLSVEPISEPSSLGGRGYTPEVVARKLTDAVGAVMTQATTRMKRERVAVDNGDRDALVPVASSQFASLISSALHFFHLSSRIYVSGEITETNGQYFLTMRMNGRMSASKTLGPTNDPNVLLAAAAREIIWRTQPYVLASADYAQNPSKARDESDVIVATHPESDPNVALAHDLLGNIATDQRRYADAEQEYREAARLAPKLGTSHHNLGNLYLAENKAPKAIEEYTTALDLEPDFALPHYGLGNVFVQQKRYGEAADQFRLAIKLDPSFALAHDGLASALKANRDWDGAIREARTTVSLAPGQATSHYGSRTRSCASSRTRRNSIWRRN